MRITNPISYFFKSLYLVFKAAFKVESRKDRFTRYALHNKWGSKESVSGGGSTLEFTANLRNELPILIQEKRITSLLDAPCGDFNWLSAVDLSGVSYIGGDIVSELVERNSRLYGTDHISFRELDIVKDPLPKADLWLCRDCLFHFRENEIFETLANFLKSDIDYILTTCSPECDKNIDMRTGSYREVNFLLEPYCFPEPELWIDDWVDPHPVQKLGLWKKSTLLSLLGSNKEMHGLL